MFDLQRIRENPEAIREAVAHKGVDIDLGGILELDDQRRRIIAEVEELKHRRNVISREVAQRKKAGESADDLIAQTREAGERIKVLDDEQRKVEADLREEC